ncbi:MAG: hypothetical protein ACD_60C00087G0031 [uncultured bacterium]|nr:MAG: hypothetical protein ACD_60C00087G0031 [uncultured bacterium]
MTAYNILGMATENKKVVILIRKSGKKKRFSDSEKQQLKDIFNKFNATFETEYSEEPDLVKISMPATGINMLRVSKLLKFYRDKLKNMPDEVPKTKKRKPGPSSENSKRFKKYRQTDKEMHREAIRIEGEIEEMLQAQNESPPKNYFQRYKNAIDLFIDDVREINHLALSIGVPQIEAKSEKIDPEEMEILTKKILAQIEEMKKIATKPNNRADIETFLEKIDQMSSKTQAIDRVYKNRKDKFENFIRGELERCQAQIPPCPLKAREGGHVFGKMVEMGQKRTSPKDRAEKAREMLGSHWDNIKELAVKCQVNMGDRDNRLVILEKIKTYLNQTVGRLREWLTLTKNQPRAASSSGVFAAASSSSSSSSSHASVVPMGLDDVDGRNNAQVTKMTKTTF